jgi:circadian clock protein KaiB
MSKVSHFKFRLYVAGEAPHSAQARANLTLLCTEHLPGRHEIEVVDVLCDPKRAMVDGILLTPMLVKHSPAPVRMIVGCLSKPETVLQALGITPL